MVEHFRDGGWGMFPTLICGVLLIAVAVRYAASPERRLVPLLTGLGVLTLATGALGFVTGLITTCGAIGSDHLEMAEQGTRITIVGFGESLNNVAFSLMFVVVAAICGSYGAFRLSKVETTGRGLAA